MKAFVNEDTAIRTIDVVVAGDHP